MASSTSNFLISPLKNPTARRLSLDWTTSLIQQHSGGNNGRKLSVPTSTSPMSTSPYSPSPSRPPSSSSSSRRHSSIAAFTHSPLINNSRPYSTTTPQKATNNKLSTVDVLLFPPSPEEEVESPPVRRETRRKSSTSRFEFTDNFLLQLSLRCNNSVSLEPETVLGRGSFGTVIAGHHNGKEGTRILSGTLAPTQLNCWK
jgi:hypothetical protein